jgi:predicted nucleic acid-binding protein
MTARQAYILDTGPVSHFARGQWLGVLKVVLKDVRVLIPDLVEAELRTGASRHSYLQAVLEADWIEVVALDTPEQLAAFTYYEQRLVGSDGRNIGECGVLALAETTADAVAVIDDRVAGLVAQGRKVHIRRTLGILCEAIRQKLLTVPLVSALADDLLENSYRLPFGPGGFARWAAEEGLT